MSEHPLWPGDSGTLLEGSRRALVQLVRGPHLSSGRHGRLWAALLNDEAAIRSRLADLFLDLVVDRESEIAFVRNVTAEIETPQVVRTAPLTFLDTAALLHLRQLLLRAAPGSGSSWDRTNSATSSASTTARIAAIRPCSASA
jgi:hypothetical protein